MTGYAIREGGEADLDAVGELHALVRNSTYKSFIRGYHSEPTTVFWRARLRVEAGSHRLLIAHAEDDGAVIGFVYVGDGILHAIHVHPDWHGRGIGRALMRAGREALVGLGFGFASLWVLEGNERACRFYERDGWVASGLARDAELDGVVWPQLEYVRELEVTQMWHNPDCSKCAAATAALDEAGVTVTLRPYLQDSPTRTELVDVLARLGAQPWEICRTGEPVAVELGMAQWPRTAAERDRWIDAMVAHPILIQRPIILLADGSAIVARSADAVTEAVERARSIG